MSLNAAAFFESQPLPLGRRIAIISNSAGVATLAADACATRQLALSEGANPLVLGARATPLQFARALAGVLDDDGVDAAMVHYIDIVGGDTVEVLAAISDVSSGRGKPVVASIIGKDGRPPARGPQIVPNFRFPEACADVLARAAARRDWLSRPLGQRSHYDDVDTPAARAVIASALGQRGDGEQGGWLSLRRAHELLRTHRIECVDTVAAPSVDEALGAARATGGPIALKADLPAPAHAGDIDAILLGLEGDSAVRAGWRELERRVGLARRPWTGALVEPLVQPGADVLVGAVADPDLGPVIALGVGGRQAGLAGAGTFRVVPVTDIEAEELIDASEGVVMQLEGFRGRPRLDRPALRELILRFGTLLGDVPELVEIDLNPVRCMTSGCVVLDARIRIERRHAAERVKTW